MRTDLDHLPTSNQHELEAITRIILDEFEEAHSRAATQWKKKGRIHRILLYGSYARGDWVYEPHTTKGYRSDYDLLIVVNHKRVAGNDDFWRRLDDIFMNMQDEHRLKVPVAIIVHTRQEVHSALVQGRYFFVDAARDSIALYQDEDKPLPRPRPKTSASELAMAQEYFDEWYPDAGEFYDAFEFNMKKQRNKNAAFQLHQCVEQLYHTTLLVHTLYTPHVHNIRYLRGQAVKIDRRFLYVWPEDNHWQRAAFNTLKEAYVKARYSKRYTISAEQLQWLGEQAQELARVVHLACSERLADLRGTVAERALQAPPARRASAAAG